MVHKKIDAVPSFLAGDGTFLKELLHPKNEHLDLNYSVAYAALAAGQTSLPHVLQEQSELYIFLSGQGQMQVGEEQVIVGAQELVLVPAGVKQAVRNTGEEDLTFLCIVHPPWKEADEKILNE